MSALPAAETHRGPVDSPTRVDVVGLGPQPPHLLSSFIGRAREVADLVGRVRSGARLITLLGPGGVGKTRLAVRVAEEVIAVERPRFPDGSVFVRLETLTDPALVAPHLAQAFGLRELPGQTPATALVDHLRDRALFLVLDNFEHLLAAAPLVSELLHECRRLVVLATSRERLGLSGEQSYPVEPLGLPALAGPEPTPEGIAAPVSEAELRTVAAAEAVHLFVERAAARNPAFALGPDNARAVAAICRRLDGLPLAIELAAGHARTLTPRALIDLLSPALPLLVDGPRDAPLRHQTLDATLAWSYDRLTLAQRTLFRRLGVFVGGASLEAAAAVIAGEDQVPADPLAAADAVLADLEVLAEQHLLRAEAGPNGEPRFTMLETTREFALRRLRAAGEEEWVRAAHAAHFLALADEAYLTGLRGPEQESWLDRLDVEHPNLRAALGWVIERNDATSALGLARSLQSFWARRGYQREALDWLTRSVALIDDETGGDRSLLELKASALLGLGNIAIDLSDYGVAHAAFEESLHHWSRLGVAGGAASALGNLGTVALRQGRLAEARERHEQSLRHWQHTDHRRFAGIEYLALGEIALAERDLAEAQRTAEAALGLFQKVGDASLVAFSYWLLGKVALARGDLLAAERLFSHAESLFTRARDREGLRRVLTAQADLLTEQQALDAARERYVRALQYSRELGNVLGIVECMEGLALLAHRLGRADSTVSLLTAAAALRERLGTTSAAARLAEIERVRDAALRDAGRTRARRAVERGRSWSLDEAADHAAALPGAPSRRAPRAAASEASTYRLTPHQIKVLQLVAQGLTDAQIADRLYISRRTVTTHMEHILAALGVERRAGAVALAIREGIITPSGPDGA